MTNDLAPAPEAVARAAPPSRQHKWGLGWHMPARVRGSSLIAWPTFLLVVVLIVPPLWSTLRLSFGHSTPLGEVTGFSFDNYQNAFHSAARTLDLVRTSLIFAVCSSILGLVLGGALAWLVSRTDMRGRGFVESVVLVSLAIPGLVFAVGWLLLLSPRGSFGPLLNGIGFHVSSLLGMIMIEGFAQIPISYLLMRAIFSSQDSSMEEVSQVCGVRPRTTVLFVTLPLALPGILSILILNLVRTLEAFEIPAIIGLPGGVRTFVSEIYRLSTSFPPDYGMVGVYAVVLIVLLALALYFNARILRNFRRFESVKGKTSRKTPQPLGSYRWLVTTVCHVFVFAVLIAPMLMLLWVALSPYYAKLSFAGFRLLTIENFKAVLSLSGVRDAFLNSLRLATISATIVVLLSALISWILIRTRLRLRGALDLLGNVPLAIPGVVMGVSLLTLYITVPLPIYGTSWILIIAYVSAFLPYGLRYAQPALVQISGDMEEAAAISGVGFFRRFISILLPLMRAALVGCWLYVFMHAFRELSRSIMLYTSGNNVISVELFGLWNDGNLSEVAAFSVALMVVLMPLGLAVRKMSGRSTDG